MTTRGAWRRAVGAALALVAGSSLALAAPAGAQTRDGEPGLTVEITNIAPAVLEPGQDLGVDVTLRNDTDEAVDRPTAVLQISRCRLGARQSLTAWAEDGTSCVDPITVAHTRSDDPLAAGQSVSLHVTLAADAVGLLDTPDAWGPRGIVLQGTSHGRVLGLRRSFVLWYPTQRSDEPPPQASLSVLVPVVGPRTAPVSTTSDEEPAPSPSPTDAATAGTDGAAPTGVTDADADSVVDATTAAELEGLTAAGGRLAETLAVVQSDPAVGVAVDPRLVTQAHAAGGTAATWADGLRQTLAQRDVATLPWADVDAAATVHAQQARLTQVAVDRSTDAALDGARVGTLLWSPSRPDARTAVLVPRLSLAGMVAPVASLTDAATQKEAASALQTVATGDGEARLLVPDPVLTDLFTAPETVEPGSSAVTASQRLLAELAVLARRDDPLPVALVAPGRGWQPDATLVAAELAAARQAPWVSLTSVSSLLDATDDATRATLPNASVAPNELAPRQVDRLADARDRAEAFAGVTSDPDARMRDVDDVVLAPLAVAWRTDPEGRDALVDAVDETVTARTSGLSIAPLSDLNVISARSELRVTVRNALAVPATVHLVVSPRKACLRADPVEPLTVDAQDERSIVVVLHATANCEVTVTARLTNPSGDVVSEPVRFQARVAPTIESVGTIVVGVLLAIGLLLGIVRTVRRGQSARRGARLQAEAAREAPLALAPLGGVAEPRADGEARPGPDAAPPERAPEPPEPPR
jgi:hypothetical protein